MGSEQYTLIIFKLTLGYISRAYVIIFLLTPSSTLRLKIMIILSHKFAEGHIMHN